MSYKMYGSIEKKMKSVCAPLTCKVESLRKCEIKTKFFFVMNDANNREMEMFDRMITQIANVN